MREGFFFIISRTYHRYFFKLFQDYERLLNKVVSNKLPIILAMKTVFGLDMRIYLVDTFYLT